jgi:peptidoglycan hydrolase-like protein with peptidoglycan-binding domain
MNAPADVLAIQSALNNVPPANGGPDPKLKEDGRCGEQTVRAIEAFQKKNFGLRGADAKIDPGGQALRKLNELLPITVTHPVATNFQMRLVTKRDVKSSWDPDTFSYRLQSRLLFNVQDPTNSRSAIYMQRLPWYDATDLLLLAANPVLDGLPYGSHSPASVTPTAAARIRSSSPDFAPDTRELTLFPAHAFGFSSACTQAQALPGLHSERPAR